MMLMTMSNIYQGGIRKKHLAYQFNDGLLNQDVSDVSYKVYLQVVKLFDEI